MLELLTAIRGIVNHLFATPFFFVVGLLPACFEPLPAASDAPRASSKARGGRQLEVEQERVIPGELVGRAAVTADDRRGVGLGGGGASLEWAGVYKSESFVRWARHESDRLLVRSEELDPASNLWSESVVGFRSSFTILSVTCRGATEFYLRGVGGNGDQVIEQWILLDVPGSYTAERGRSTTPFGEPFAGSTSTQTTVVGGGPFEVERVERVELPEMLRVELYRGSDYGEIGSRIAPDLDGRFLHFTGGPSHPGIYTVGLFGLPPEEPVMVVGAEVLPELAQVSGIEDRDSGLINHYHAAHGWIWMISMPLQSLHHIFAIDGDNDGVPTAFDYVTHDVVFDLYPWAQWEFDRHDWWW